MLKLVLVILCSLFSLQACKSLSDDPRYQDLLTRPSTEYSTDEVAYTKRAYLGMRLLEPNARRSAVRYLSQLPYEFKLSEQDNTSTALSFAGDAISGSTNSSLGAALSFGNALFGSDGSSSVASGVMLPSSIDGKELTTIESANMFVVSLMKKTVRDLYKIEGYEGSCVLRCNSFNETHLFVRNDDKITGEYIYLPERFAITFMVRSLVGADESASASLDSIAVGFPVKWKSRDGYGTSIYIQDSLVTNSSGKLQTNNVLKPHLMLRPEGDRGLEKTKFGRELLRSMYSNPYIYHGNDEGGYFAYNGEIYQFWSNSTKAAFASKIIN